MHDRPILNRIFLALIDLYRLVVSPLLPGRCRFYPSCSAYARECFEALPPHRALVKSVWRILRCNPWNEGYFDPVFPEQKPGQDHGESCSQPSHSLY